MPRLSPLNWIKKLVELAPEHASRATRIMDELPHTSQLYSPRAVAEALNTSPELTTLNPREFKHLALNLPEDQAAPYVEHYAELLRKGDWVEPAPDLFLEHYLEKQRSRPFEGFSDVPFLDLKLDQNRGQAIGHEGRHRFRAIDELYGPDEESLVRIRPQIPRFIYSQNPGSIGYVDTLKKRRFAKGGLNQCRTMGSHSKPNGR